MDRPAPAATLAITATGLRKRYGSADALVDVDLAIPVGTVTGLLGPDGSGKSTLLRILAGLVRPGAGTASVAGIEVGRDGLALHRAVGVLAEGDPLYDWMTGRELLAFAAELAGTARLDIPERVAATLDRVGLGDVADGRIGTYRQGQRRRLGLGQALIGEPGVLLLDEPLAGLDPPARADLRALIAGLRGRATVVLSSVEPADLEPVCDRVVVLHDGRVVADARMDALLGGAAATAYLVALERPPGLALAGLVARLKGEAWVRSIQIDGLAMRITVLDEARASRELLPSIVATGLAIASVRRERPTLAEAVVELAERRRREAAS